MPSASLQPKGTAQGRILVIDDEEAIRESLQTLLELEDWPVETAATAMEGVSALQDGGFDLVLLDLMLPDISGLEALKEIRKFDRSTPVIVLTAYGSVENAVSAIKLGADDFFTKPWNNEKLLLGIRKNIDQRRLRDENAELRSALKQRYSFSNIVGKSENMLRVFDLVTQVAPSRSTVLVHGESGTGKELIARAIHAHSPRADKPFVPVNSSSIPIDLIESTLFGHVRGAFTGATHTRKGCFELADGGTIFLDDVGTLALDTQAKLLRVIQEREFMPVGSSLTVQVDVRIVAATNEDLRKRVEEGTFREDLYYRLNVIEIDLPPLRERREDIPLLVQHFFNKYCRENQRFLDERGESILRFSPEAMRVLMDHDWRGNVRELENVVERAVVLANDPMIPPELLPESLLAANGRRPPRIPPNFRPSAGASLPEIMEEFERQLLIDELEKCHWSQTEAAKKLHVALSTLNQKVQRLGIDVKKLREERSALPG